MPQEIILLAVTGMSPAIITETIWALAHEEPAQIPHRVIAVTTSRGRDQIQKHLFQPTEQLADTTPWQALRDTLSAVGHDLDDRLRFGTTGDDIRVITTTDPATGTSTELPDLQTPADNNAAADYILEQVRAIVENQDTQLIASLAGGRKTMGALLYACMNLIARSEDRLTHVLVNPPYDTLPHFWFPHQPGQDINHPHLDTVHPASDARLQLADVPFVPLRNLFHKQLGHSPGGFANLVASCTGKIHQQAAENLRLTLTFSTCELIINQHRAILSPKSFLFLAFLFHAAKSGNTEFRDYYALADEFNTQLAQWKESYSHPDNPSMDKWADDDYLNADLSNDDIRDRRSRLKEELKKKFPNGADLDHALPTGHNCSILLKGSLIDLRLPSAS